MIVSRPQRKTIFSLGLFTLVIFVALVISTRAMLSGGEVPTWRYVVTGLLLLTASFLLHKLIFNYKVLKISHDKFHIYYPFRFYRSVQDVKELGAWQQTVVNTNKTEFKELKLVFVNKGYVKITNQENSDYDKVYKYVKRKAPKKEVKD